MFQESDIDSALTPTSDISMGDTEVRSLFSCRRFVDNKPVGLPQTVALSEVEAPPSSFGPTEAGTDVSVR